MHRTLLHKKIFLYTTLFLSLAINAHAAFSFSDLNTGKFKMVGGGVLVIFALVFALKGLGSGSSYAAESRLYGGGKDTIKRLFAYTKDKRKAWKENRVENRLHAMDALLAKEEINLTSYTNDLNSQDRENEHKILNEILHVKSMVRDDVFLLNEYIRGRKLMGNYRGDNAQLFAERLHEMEERHATLKAESVTAINQLIVMVNSERKLDRYEKKSTRQEKGLEQTSVSVEKSEGRKEKKEIKDLLDEYKKATDANDRQKIELEIKNLYSENQTLKVEIKTGKEEQKTVKKLLKVIKEKIKIDNKIKNALKDAAKDVGSNRPDRADAKLGAAAQLEEDVQKVITFIQEMESQIRELQEKKQKEISLETEQINEDTALQRAA